jgi:cytochrome c peroxidase
VCTLEQQAAVPITNPFEMASLSWLSVTLCYLVSYA